MDFGFRLWVLWLGVWFVGGSAKLGGVGVGVIHGFGFCVTFEFLVCWGWMASFLRFGCACFVVFRISFVVFTLRYSVFAYVGVYYGECEGC